MGFFKKYRQPVENPTMRVLSLGAGVQSSVMALLAARGIIGPMPDCAIFADTQSEPEEVYTHLEWLEKQLPFPVYRVTAGNIRKDALSGLSSKHRFASMPFFTSGGGMGRRQCTNEYKIQPIRRKIRELVGLKKGERAKGIVIEQWIGISTDEFQRMTKSRDKWIANRWPLLEEEMSREDCKKWFSGEYPNKTLAKSACLECPYHSNEEWRQLTDQQFKEVCDFDDAIRVSEKMTEKQYLHAARIPLREVDLTTPSDHGQYSFLDECEGMCGV